MEVVADRKHFQDECRNDVLKRWGERLLILGLVGEIAFGIATSNFSGTVIAKMRRATVELQSTIAPRDLTEDTRRKIVAACGLFSGNAVHVRSQIMDLEGWRLAQQIIASLRAARLNVEDDTLNMFPGFGTVIVGVRVSGPPAEEALASAVRSSLGQLADPGQTFNRVPQDENFVTVFVGVKPLPAIE